MKTRRPRSRPSSAPRVGAKRWHSLAIVVLLWLPGIVTSQAGALDNWVLRNPLPTPQNLNGIAFGNGLFIAAGDLGTVLRSPDGVHWDVVQQTSSSGWLTRATFALGSFLVGGESGTILQSGVLGALSQRPRFEALAYTGLGELRLAITSDPNSIVILESSQDLKSWTSAGILTNLNGRGNVTLQAASPVFYRAREVSE